MAKISAASRDNSQPVLQQAFQLFQESRFAEARQLCQQVLAADAKNADAWHVLGLVARGDGRLDIAIDCLKKSVALQPDSIESRNNFASALKEAGFLEDAANAYRDALRLRKDDAVLHSNLGSVLNNLKRYEEAKKHLMNAVEKQPDYADAWYNLAVVQSTLGEREAKQESIARILSLEPQHAAALLLRAQGQKEHPAEEITHLETVFNHLQASSENKMHVAFALGKALDDLGRYEQAFGWFAKANEIKRRSYVFDIHQTASQFDRIKQVVSKEWIAAKRAKAYREKAPVFILGMPRSGTSLVEQILAQHSEIYGGGELTILRDLLAEQERAQGRSYPETLIHAGDDPLYQLAKAYAKKLYALAPAKKYITDKLPGNFIHAGLIAAILGEAKIIHVERDGMDNGLSIFKTFFGDHLPYAYDQWEIGRMIAMCGELMNYWESVLPAGAMLKIRYEELVENTEAESRRMLEFLELPWEETCLKFHESKRPVATASVNQVRRPIYKSAMKSAGHYDAYLAPLKAAL